MKNNKIIFTLIFLILASFLPSYALANGTACSTPAPQSADGITDPLGLTGNPVQTLIGRVLKAVLGIVGSLALVMFIYGGFVWMTSSGNKERVEKGKNIITWATIGLVVIFASYAIVNFLFKDILGLT